MLLQVVLELCWPESIFALSVFNTCSFLVKVSFIACYRKHEHDKKQSYDQTVCKVKHECFSQLVFSIGGGMDPIANTVLVCL